MFWEELLLCLGTLNKQNDFFKCIHPATWNNFVASCPPCPEVWYKESCQRIKGTSWAGIAGLSKWFWGQDTKNCMCSTLQQLCYNFWGQELGGGITEKVSPSLIFPTLWNPTVLCDCPCGFSSYAAYMHEYSIMKHEQHTSTLPFSLTHSSLHSGSSDKETVFIPWDLFGICEISQTGVKKWLFSYVCCYVSCY